MLTHSPAWANAVLPLACRVCPGARAAGPRSFPVPLSLRGCSGRCEDDLGGRNRPACRSACPAVFFGSIAENLGGTGTCRFLQGDTVAAACCGCSTPVAMVSPTWVGTNWFGNADGAL